MANSPTASTKLERIRSWLRSDMRVMRWVLLGVYGLMLVALITLPLYSGSGGDGFFQVLIFVAGIFVAQGLFVFGSGTITLCRPIRKRRLVLPIIVASFMFVLLLAGFLVAMIEFFYLDGKIQSDFAWYAFWMLMLGSWIIWGALLFIYAKQWRRFAVLTRLSTALFAGSLLELLATVPAHIVVSRRPGCLVGIGTMLGIIAGLSVMFFAFGPMILVLFLRPRYRNELASNQLCEGCGYDLRANKVRIPECGREFSAPANHASLDPSET